MLFWWKSEWCPITSRRGFGSNITLRFVQQTLVFVAKQNSAAKSSDQVRSHHTKYSLNRVAMSSKKSANTFWIFFMGGLTSLLPFSALSTWRDEHALTAWTEQVACRHELLQAGCNSSKPLDSKPLSPSVFSILT